MKKNPPSLTLPELRRITPGLFAVKIPRSLLARIKKLPELQQSDSGKDIFYFETEDPGVSDTEALELFRETLVAAGLGPYFGIGTFTRPVY